MIYTTVDVETTTISVVVVADEVVVPVVSVQKKRHKQLM